ncbi:MAG: glycosyltransferase family 4 protein [Actinomycetota bacterium]
MTAIRLLVVNPSPIRGGAEALLEELAWNADPDRLQVTVANLAPGAFPSRLAEGGARTVDLDARRLRYPWHWARTVHALRRLAVGHDAVWSWQVKGNYYGTPAARLAKKPCAWWDHGIRPAKGEPRYLIDHVLPNSIKADRVIVSSQAAARRHRNAEVIHPGVRTGDVSIDRAAARSSLGYGDGPVIGSVGRLQPWKGQHLLIDAMPEICSRHLEARLVVIGDALGGFSAEYPGQLRERASRLGVTSQVDFLGHREDVHSLLPAFDVFVTPSIAEPFGIVTVEAMAAGVPVIGTDSGGTPEILADGAGLVIPTGDPQAIARLVVSLLDDPGRAANIARIGQQRARERFSIERFLEDCMRSVEALVDR